MAENNVLYFVDYSPGSEGGIISAHDLKNGKRLWSTQLQAAGFTSHFGYSNEIFMLLTEDAIEIAGDETAGNYVEVLDRATGRMLANKQFKNSNFPKRQDYELR